MMYRICRKTRNGFESEQFASLEDVKAEKKKNGGFIDFWDDKLKCWRQLKELK